MRARRWVERGVLRMQCGENRKSDGGGRKGGEMMEKKMVVMVGGWVGKRNQTTILAVDMSRTKTRLTCKL